MFSKKNIVIISTFLLTVLTLIMVLSALNNIGGEEANADAVRIVLDAGHGGVDGGVEGRMTKVKESELNLKVVKKLEKLLISGGFSVTLTRNTDAGLYGVANGSKKKKDMQKRKEIIEKVKPNLVISVHMNFYPVSSRCGGQTFYKGSDENAYKLASSVQREFNKLNLKGKDYSALKGDYFILNCTEYTSIIAECGFLSNPEEEKLLISEEYQDKIAYAIFVGIIDYFSQTSFVFCD